MCFCDALLTFFSSLDGHLDICELLLDNGADESIAFTEKWTPLRKALIDNRRDIVKLLVNVSLSKDSFLKSHGTPSTNITLDLACGGYTEELRMIYSKHDEQKHVRDLNGRTALHLAAGGGHMDIFEYLISIGLDPEDKDEAGRGLLSYSAVGGSLDIMKAVLRKTSIPSSKDGEWTALHWACRSGSKSIIEHLLGQGLQSTTVPTTQPSGNWAPASIAIYHGHSDMLEKLSAFHRTKLDASVDLKTEQAMEQTGIQHHGYHCDGCEQAIYGPRWNCSECEDWDHCFMCQPFLKHVHENHSWEIMQPEE